MNSDNLIFWVLVACLGPTCVIMLIFIAISPIIIIHELIAPSSKIELTKVDWNCVNTRTILIGKTVQVQCILYQLTEANK